MRTLGCGRTDAGVHAEEYFAMLELEEDFSIKGLTRGLNTKLPADIVILDAWETQESFHPLRDVAWKEYIYRFRFGPGLAKDPLVSDFMLTLPYDLRLGNMMLAAKLFEGEHDFLRYHTTGSEPAGTVRKVLESSIESVEASSWLPAHYIFRVRGEGFLKQMVRLMMGTLFNVGNAKLSLEAIENSFKEGTGHLGAVVPAHGLALTKVQLKA